MFDNKLSIELTIAALKASRIFTHGELKEKMTELIETLEQAKDIVAEIRRLTE